MSETLTVLADRRVMGEIRCERSDRHLPELTFTYEDRWRSWGGAYPLSLQMPLSESAHEHAKIEPWMRNLLPDSRTILSHWGVRFQVPPNDPFAMLAVVGEDCPGAIQLVRPERVNAVLRDDRERVVWVSDAEVAERLNRLRQNRAAWRLEADAGQFSLAGAQAKTALLFDGRRWGIPSGPTPTTHILKPPATGFEGLAENEHVCLSLARALGLPAAETTVRTFEGESALVVTRYDRARRDDGSIRRLHQEDFCQALGVPPEQRYEQHGGPACGTLSELLWGHSSAPAGDVRTFAGANLFNWLIGGTDAHAKNYSVMIGSKGRVRLAPLYDVASAVPHVNPTRLRFANRIGGKYRTQDIRARHWKRFAAEVNLPVEKVIEMGLLMADRLPDELRKITARAHTQGIDHPIMESLVNQLSDRARYCAGVLQGHAMPEGHAGFGRRPRGTAR